MEREYVNIRLQNRGLISATFHHLLDRMMRIMNYGQQRSFADVELLP